MYAFITLSAAQLLTTFSDKRGNLILIIICGANFVIYILTYFFYRDINRHRDQQWNRMTNTVCTDTFRNDQPNLPQQEQETYLETTKDQGNERLDFRFAY
jgi:hypothetical protein